MAAASVLPTPPNSPCRKPVVIHIASTATVPATPPSQPVKGPQDSSQSHFTPTVNATLNTNTISSPRTTATKAAGSTPPRTIAVLKSDLRIIDWRCGAQTLTNTTCQRRISDDNKQRIDAQLASMTGLTRASSDFEPALLKLLKLVNCYQHDAGLPKERRLEAWRLAFPPSSADGSKPEVPVEQLIRKALRPLSTECMAHDNGRACEKGIGGQKVYNCKRTLQELVKQDVYSDDVKLEFLLEVLEWNSTCSIHQSSKQFTWVATWKKSIMAVLPLPKPIANNAPNGPQTPPGTRAGPLIVTPTTTEKDVAIVQVQVIPSPHASPNTTPSSDGDPALYWPKAYDTSTFEILAHANHHVSPTQSYKLIRSELRRSRRPRDPQDGYIYAYEVEGNSGYVKIGYTTLPVTDRHDKWAFDCNRQSKTLYPPPPSTAASISSGAAETAAAPAAAPALLVPHARRVEALCHAELDHRRIRIYCGACLKQHIEWFEATAAEVTAVIQKWSRWMTTQPYELRQLKDGVKWTLKGSEIRRTRRIEQFMLELAV